MASKMGILTVVISNNDYPSTYLGTIKSCDGVKILFKGLDLLEVLKLNGGSLKPEQLQTLANGVGAHEDITINIDGKKFVFAPLIENQNPVLPYN